MAELICLFFPTLLTFTVLDKTLDLFSKIRKYAFYNILINSIVISIFYFEKDNRELIFDNMFTIVVTLKYLLVASFIALFLPRFVAFFKKNISIKISLRKIENEKHKKNM